jgi:hypothetical protein
LILRRGSELARKREPNNRSLLVIIMGERLVPVFINHSQGCEFVAMVTTHLHALQREDRGSASVCL